MLVFLFISVILLYIILLTKINKQTLNPINILIIWWSFWTLYAYSPLALIYQLSDKLLILILLMLSGLFFGNFIHQSYFPNRYTKYNIIKKEIFIDNFIVFYKWSYVLIFLIILNYFFRSINIMMTYGVDGFRALAFSMDGQVSIIFGNPYIEVIYGMFIGSYLLFYLIIGSILLVENRKKYIFFVTVIMIIMDTIMHLGRFGLYHIIVVSFFVIFFSVQKNVAVKKMILILVMLLISTIIIIGSLRQENFLEDFFNIIGLVHTISFGLLNHEIINSHSYLNQEISFGSGTIYGLNFILSMIIRRLDNSYVNNYFNFVGDQDEFTLIGEYASGVPIYANAYYSIIYTLYADGRELYIFLFSFFIGFFISKTFYLYRYTFSLFNFFIFIFLMYLMFFSIFMSQIESMRNWIIFILIIVITILKRRVIKDESNNSNTCL